MAGIPIGGVSVGQSVGGGLSTNFNQPVFDIASLSPSAGAPQNALDGPNPNAINTILRFPGDTPPYYMALIINDYSRASWTAVGALNETARIILPLPQTMVDSHNVRYDVSDIGIGGAVGFDMIAGAGQQMVKEAGVGAVLGALGVGGQALSKLIGGPLGKTVSDIGSGALAAAGLAVNSFMTVMLKSPDYKRRQFVWRFSPKNRQETSDLRRIIQLINNSMAPSLNTNLGSCFFNWPSIWQPIFYYNGQNDLLSLNTFKMKKSVITDASFNYTPMGVFSPFASSKAPTSVEMTLTFLELEFWLKGSFDDGANPDSQASLAQVVTQQNAAAAAASAQVGPTGGATP